MAQAANETRTNVYVGAGPSVVYATEAKDVCTITFTGQCVVESATKTAWHVFAGVETSGHHLGLEFGWVGLGEIEIQVPLESDRGVVAGSTVYGAVKIAYPNASRFTPFSKVGIHLWERKSNFAVRLVEVQDGVDSLFGFGIDYELRKNLAIRIEWTRYVVKVKRQDLDSLAGRSEYFGDDRDIFGVGVLYRF